MCILINLLIANEDKNFHTFLPSRKEFYSFPLGTSKLRQINGNFLSSGKEWFFCPARRAGENSFSVPLAKKIRQINVFHGKKT